MCLAPVALMWSACTCATTSSPTYTGAANLRDWLAYTAPGCIATRRSTRQSRVGSRRPGAMPTTCSAECQREGEREGAYEVGGDEGGEEGGDEHAVHHAVALEPAHPARESVVQVDGVAVAAHPRVRRHVILCEPPPARTQRVARLQSRH